MAETAKRTQAENHIHPSGETKTLYVDFLCFKVDASFRKLEASEKNLAIKDFQKILEAKEHPPVRIRPYLTLGLRAEIDFLLWVITEDVEKIQELVSDLYQTLLGSSLTLVYSFLALKKPSQYALPHLQAFEKEEPPKKFLFIYPFVKTREWYLLPFEKRKAIMDEHFKIGHQYPTVRLNTTYSFGLGDQDFVLAFEAEDPADFEDLVQRLRETESSRFTVRDTPMIMATAQSVPSLLKRLGL